MLRGSLVSCSLAAALLGGACRDYDHNPRGTKAPAPAWPKPPTNHDTSYPDDEASEGEPLGDVTSLDLPGERPRLDVDGLGNAILAWQSSQAVLAIRYVAGDGFSGPIELVGPLVPDVLRSRGVLHAVATRAGRAIVLWDQAWVDFEHSGMPNGSWLMASRYDSPDGWLDPERVAFSRLGAEGDPQLTLLDTNHAVASWHAHDDSLMHANAFYPDFGWGIEGAIDEGGGSVSDSVAVPVPGGAANVAWTWYEERETYVDAARFSAAEGFSPLPRIAGYGVTLDLFPGRAGCIDTAEGTFDGFYFRRLLCGDGPSEPILSPLADPINGLDGDGMVFFALPGPVESPCEGQLIGSRFLSDGWSEPVVIETGILGFSQPIVAANENDDVVIAGGGYRDDGGEDYSSCVMNSVWVRKLDRPERVELDAIEAPGRIGDVALDVDPDGRAFVAWTRFAADGDVNVRLEIVE